MAVTTSDLADQLVNTHGLAKSDAKKLVDAVFANLTAAVAGGEEVSINGFGKFKVKDVPERQGRNPSNGEAITIQRPSDRAPAPPRTSRGSSRPSGRSGDTRHVRRSGY